MDVFSTAAVVTTMPAGAYFTVAAGVEEISARWFALNAARLSANNKVRGVKIYMTKAGVFDMEPQ